jgi:hypothetical protein
LRFDNKKKVDNEGNIKTVGYDVFRVNSYFLNDNPTETSEGKRYKKQKDAEKMQLTLFED